MVTQLDLAPTVLAMCQSLEAHGGGIRVGVDVVSIAWFARQLDRGGDPALVRSAYTAAERAYCSGRAERLAVRWAAKEAISKAIGTGFRGLRPADIEIVHCSNGRVEVAAAAGSNWPHHAQEWSWELTLCHEDDAALAVAVGIMPGADSLASPDPSRSPIPVGPKSQNRTHRS